MAKQTVNIGTTANDRTGDNLRTAFNKINANFTELYTTLGLDEAPLNLGAFEFTGSTITTTDSSSVIIDQATTVTSDLTVGGDILPSTALGGDLGSSTKPWKSLYVSGGTIYIGDTSISVNENGDFLLGGQALVDVANNSDQTLNTTDEVAFAEVSVGNLRVAPISNGVELSNSTNDIIITAQDDFTVSTTTGDINLYTTAGSVGIDATGGLLQIQGQDGVDISSALGDIDLNAFSNNIVFKSPVNFQNVPVTNLSNIGSEGNIDISVNLSDSTKYTWRFGEDGDLTFPDGTSQTTALRTSQDESSVAIGGSGTDRAGDGISAQGEQAIAIGLRAARSSQGNQAVAIGSQTGEYSQGIGAVAIGTFAGASSQTTNAIAIGTYAGQTNQGSGAIAIGRMAGFTGQAIRSIAIGDSAGKTDQHEGTIVLNSTGSPLDTEGIGRFYVKSIRNVTGGSVPSGFYPAYYNPSTGEFIVVSP